MMVHRKADVERAQREHDKDVDPDSPVRDDDDLVVLTRREDRSPWWRASWYLQKYIVVWAPVMWVITALGFGLVTPNKKADELKEQLTAASATLQRQIDSIRVVQLKFSERSENNERALSVLVRQACIDRRVTQYDKQLIGLIDSRGACIR